MTMFAKTISTLTTCCIDHFSVATCYLALGQRGLSLESFKAAAEIFLKYLPSQAEGLENGVIP